MFVSLSTSWVSWDDIDSYEKLNNDMITMNKKWTKIIITWNKVILECTLFVYYNSLNIKL